MNYDRVFERVEEEDGHSKPIRVRGLSRKYGRLFDDVFNSHARSTFKSTTPQLIRADKMGDRLITQDSIVSTFYGDEKYYIPPKIKCLDTQAEEDMEYKELYETLLSDNGTFIGVDGEEAGSNRICYITGAIGDGKTALMSKMLYDIASSKEKIFPIYISIDSDWTLKDDRGSTIPNKLDNKFMEFLLEYIKSQMAFENKAHKDLPCVPENIDSSTKSPIDAIKKLISIIKENNFRVIFIFDDLDRYHFYQDKFTLFVRSKESEFGGFINEIRTLTNHFSKFDNTHPLAFLGITVVFVVRDNVYKTLHPNNALNLREGVSQRYQIDTPSYGEVVEKRLAMLSDCIELVESGRKKGVYANQLANKFIPMNNFLSKGDLTVPKYKKIASSDNLDILFSLSPHGCRSVIEFIGGLKILIMNEGDDVYRRYFELEHSSFIILYMLKHYRLYTQANNHFPNLFLVDAHVTKNVVDEMEFPDAFKPHRHTYWLKYLILSYLNSCPNGRCGIGKLIGVFSDEGRYEESIVRLVIGSLSTPSQFTCTEIDDNNTRIAIEKRSIKITERGRYLFSNGTNNSGVPFCFSLNYLELVIDDYLLYLPPEMIRKRRSLTDYSHLYGTAAQYSQGLIDNLKNKTFIVIEFLKVLECSYLAEKLRSPDLFKELENSQTKFPDFNKNHESLMKACGNLIKVAYRYDEDQRRRESKQFNNRAKVIRTDTQYTKFFAKHYLGEGPTVVI